MQQNKNTPSIRFAGFTDAWEQRKLGEVVDVCSGCDYKSLSEGTIPVYGTGGYMLSVNKALSYTEDAVGIGRKGTIDKPYILRAPFWTVDTLFYAVPRMGYDLQFVLGVFLKIDWKKKDESTGVPSLSKVTINTTEIVVPKVEEQRKIGNLLQSIDRLITLHQRKYDQLVNIKKSMLEKMFPKNGKTVPEVRFAGFTDVWEQRKLGEITSSYSGGTPSAGNKEFYVGQIPFIRSGEIHSSSTELFINNRALDSSSAKLVKKGDILYALYGATSGEVSRAQLDGAINQAILAIIPTSGQDADFIVEWLRKEKQNITSTYLQGGQGNLSAQIVKELLVSIARPEEQQKIGRVFRKINDLITLHQRKLERLKNIKKACLEKMFV